MASAISHRFNASDRSYFAILKKEIHAIAAAAGFTAKKLAEIDIIVAELVSNLGKHAVSGELFVKVREEENINGLEITTIDMGPGMSDVNRLMTDGVSTKGTLGHGLGTIKRMSDVFQVYSSKGWGTVMYCVIYTKALPQRVKQKKTEIRSLVVPKPGETFCGDGFYYKESSDHLKLFLSDGLGHGKEAQAATDAAIEAFKVCPYDSPLDNLRFIHTSVKRTRGLVGTVIHFDKNDRRLRICGIGNIQTRIQGPNGTRNYIGYNGIIGMNIPNTISDQEIVYEKGQVIMMCSDGIKSRWDVMKYPGILRNDLSLAAAALFHDFARNTDDMSIAVCKISI
ncbi:ATP-binding protein [Chitinophaga horti]|uniref:ATP-binding protein n=1 Tax=Chitinophaga horti TaxID=2920382 RepID=A0ABY6IZ45_9BACT|nr:ATP-binding protein [Chitinophaga horti]UYQ92645.1 ATP-binding protein [Chitinophaga horti]